jgi:hypothetical protein
MVIVMVMVMGVAPAWAGGARGTVNAEGFVIQVSDALAWQQADSWGGEGQETHVLLTEKVIARAGLETTLDFESALEARKEAAGQWVELEFAPDGTWRSIRYQFRAGTSSTSGMKGFGENERPKGAAVTVGGGAVRGTVNVKTEDYSDASGPALALAIDAPLHLVPEGTPLPSNGAEPGEAVVGCWSAFQGRDEAGVKKYCAELGYWLDVYQRQGDDMNEFWDPSRFGHCSVFSYPQLNMTGGRLLGDEAEIAVNGRVGETDCSGKVYLKREGGDWKVTSARS